MIDAGSATFSLGLVRNIWLKRLRGRSIVFMEMTGDGRAAGSPSRWVNCLLRLPEGTEIMQALLRGDKQKAVHAA